MACYIDCLCSLGSQKVPCNHSTNETGLSKDKQVKIFCPFDLSFKLPTQQIWTVLKYGRVNVSSLWGLFLWINRNCLWPFATFLSWMFWLRLWADCRITHKVNNLYWHLRTDKKPPQTQLISFLTLIITHQICFPSMGKIEEVWCKNDLLACSSTNDCLFPNVEIRLNR